MLLWLAMAAFHTSFLCPPDFSFLRQCLSISHLAVLCWAVALLQATAVFRRRAASRRAYLLDFACFKPRDSMKCNLELGSFLTRSNAHRFTLPSMYLQHRVFLRSSLQDETYLPESLFTSSGGRPPFECGREEAADVLFGSVQELLQRARISPEDIAILITNCSLHSPAPSYAAMIINRFKMREDCQAFHLAGMGCSTSLIACKLACDLLRTKPNRYALVVSTENITLNWYPGNEKPMLVTNCIFRVGCAAMLFTNKQSERRRCKYELLHVVRTHGGADDKSFHCVEQREDSEGIVGTALSKDLMNVAAKTLLTHMRTLGPLILPYSEQLRYVFSLFCKEALKMRVKQYQPDFKLAVKHFCIHAGGRPVIHAIDNSLSLGDYNTEPSLCTLQRWGNTSASSVWYVLAYMEAKERIKARDKVWMIALGSGFKCNSAVLKAISDVPSSQSNPWADCLNRYPVKETKR